MENFHDRYFFKDELEEKLQILEQGKSFKEIDTKNVFYSQIPAKGILGCVIEQSVLGIKQNSLQEADLEVMQENGEYKATELKVTGVQHSNKDNHSYQAKEPMSITAVSIGNIEKEEFLKSHFYNKIAHMIWVFYVYDRKPGQRVVPYKEYERFKVLGYKFLDIADDKIELARFRNDWLLVQQYLIEANKTKNPERLYPLLHTSIKDKLLYIDIAPRYRNNPKQTPRFRLKKTYVDAVFQEYFSSKRKIYDSLEKLPLRIDSFEELELILRRLTDKYKDKTIEELLEYFDDFEQEVPICEKKKSKRTIIPKQVAETVVVNMFGGASKKISDIELFNKIGVIGKSVVITKNQGRTEDMKLFTLNLHELYDQQIEFEETAFYQYFSEHRILCIMYEEPSKDALLKDNKFLGFKWFTFNDQFIDNTIRKVYDIIKDRLINNTLEEKYIYKKNGEIRINRTGVPMVELNFPKASDYAVFVRGTGNDSGHKPWRFKGKAADGTDIINSYIQQVWIKGSYLTGALKKVDFI